MNNSLKKYLPSPIVTLVKNLKRNYRRNKLESKKKQNQIIYKDSLIEDLKSLGIKEGDNVIVHSSLSKIGYVDGGAQTVIDALSETVGDSGTLLFPAFPANTFNKTYLEENPVFHILNTESKMGIITELFRKQQGVKRSFHPTDSVCAKGSLAEYFTKDHFGQLTPYNKFSPFYKLCEKKGKILMIGVPLETCTNLHTLEDAVDFKYPVYDEKILEVKMIDESGKEHLMKTKVHNPEYSVKRKCSELAPIFEKENVLVKGKIGEADAMLINASTMHETMLRYYYERGVTMYTPYGT